MQFFSYQLRLTLYFYTVDNDYSASNFPNITTLNENCSQACYTITTTDDLVVEGEEDFRLQYNILDRLGHFSLLPAGHNVTVTIIDNDSEWHRHSN